MIRFVAGLAEIVEDLEAAIDYYRERLGLEVDRTEGLGYAEVRIGGINHFGIWERSDAAEATLGDRARASEIPLGFLVGYEVDEVGAAIERIGDALQARQEEPWGQVTARFIGPSGALFEVSETPWARELPPAGE